MSRIRLVLLLIAAVPVVGLATAVAVSAQFPSSSQVARSSRGVVATAHPLATAAGVAILEAGGNAADAAAVGQAIALGFKDSVLMGQPGGAERLTSKALARERAREVHLPSLGTGLPQIVSQPERPSDHGHTTHLSVVDADGMAVSLTQTVGPLMGSQVVAPALGFVYAATLGGYLGDMGPGALARSFISPLVVSKDGEPVLILGAAGGARIVSAVVQVVLRVLEQGHDLPVAIAEPRVHTRFADGEIELETSPGIGWSDEVLEQLREWGLDVSAQPRTGAFGRVHALHFHADTQEWEAVADPDWEGTAGSPSGRQD